MNQKAAPAGNYESVKAEVFEAIEKRSDNKGDVEQVWDSVKDLLQTSLSRESLVKTLGEILSGKDCSLDIQRLSENLSDEDVQKLQGEIQGKVVEIQSQRDALNRYFEDLRKGSQVLKLENLDPDFREKDIEKVFIPLEMDVHVRKGDEKSKEYSIEKVPVGLEDVVFFQGALPKDDKLSVFEIDGNEVLDENFMLVSEFLENTKGLGGISFLEGQWGSGKTSVLNHMVEQEKHLSGTFDCHFLNVWKDLRLLNVENMKEFAERVFKKDETKKLLIIDDIDRVSPHDKKLWLGWIQKFYRETGVSVIIATDEAQVLPCNKFLLQGVVGAGKTTTLKHFISSNLDMYQELGRIPVFVKASDCVEKLEVGKEQSLQNILPEGILLEDGKIDFFIDGLDEVSQAVNREKLLQILETFQNSDYLFILSSRFIQEVEKKSTLDSFQRLTLQDVTDKDDRKTFIVNYLNGTNLVIYNKNREEVHSLADKDIEPLLQFVGKEDSGIQELVKTPGGLMHLCIAYKSLFQKSQGDLTKVRESMSGAEWQIAGVYRQAIDYVLSGKEKEKENVPRFELLKEYQSILYYIAFLSIELGGLSSKEIGKDVFENACDSYFCNTGQGRGLTQDQTTKLKDEVFKSNLIYKNTSGNYEFLHLSYKEYFIAEYFASLEDGVDVIFEIQNEDINMFYSSSFFVILSFYLQINSQDQAVLESFFDKGICFDHDVNGFSLMYFYALALEANFPFEEFVKSKKGEEFYSYFLHCKKNISQELLRVLPNYYCIEKERGHIVEYPEIKTLFKRAAEKSKGVVPPVYPVIDSLWLHAELILQLAELESMSDEELEKMAYWCEEYLCYCKTLEDARQEAEGEKYGHIFETFWKIAAYRKINAEDLLLFDGFSSLKMSSDFLDTLLWNKEIDRESLVSFFNDLESGKRPVEDFTTFKRIYKNVYENFKIGNLLLLRDNPYFCEFCIDLLDSFDEDGMSVRDDGECYDVLKSQELYSGVDLLLSHSDVAMRIFAYQILLGLQNFYDGMVGYSGEEAQIKMEYRLARCVNADMYQQSICDLFQTWKNGEMSEEESTYFLQIVPCIFDSYLANNDHFLLLSYIKGSVDYNIKIIILNGWLKGDFLSFFEENLDSFSELFEKASSAEEKLILAGILSKVSSYYFSFEAFDFLKEISIDCDENTIYDILDALVNLEENNQYGELYHLVQEDLLEAEGGLFASDILDCISKFTKFPKKILSRVVSDINLFSAASQWLTCNADLLSEEDILELIDYIESREDSLEKGGKSILLSVSTFSENSKNSLVQSFFQYAPGYIVSEFFRHSDFCYKSTKDLICMALGDSTSSKYSLNENFFLDKLDGLNGVLEKYEYFLSIQKLLDRYLKHAEAAVRRAFPRADEIFSEFTLFKKFLEEFQKTSEFWMMKREAALLESGVTEKDIRDILKEELKKGGVRVEVLEEGIDREKVVDIVQEAFHLSERALPSNLDVIQRVGEAGRNGRDYVLKTDDGVVCGGFLDAAPTDEQGIWFGKMMVIDPDLHSLGLGELLMRGMCKDLKAQGVKYLDANVPVYKTNNLLNIKNLGGVIIGMAPREVRVIEGSTLEGEDRVDRFVIRWGVDKILDRKGGQEFSGGGISLDAVGGNIVISDEEMKNYPEVESGTAEQFRSSVEGVIEEQLEGSGSFILNTPMIEGISLDKIENEQERILRTRQQLSYKIALDYLLEEKGYCITGVKKEDNQLQYYFEKQS